MRLRPCVVLLLLTMMLGACGDTASQPSVSRAPVALASIDASVADTAVPSTVASPAVAETTAATSSSAATAAPSATATLDVPTQAPTITAQPAASPFPLNAGWWDSAVCYEVFVRSFRDSNGDGIGDLNGLIEKLDYINDGDPAQQKDLGANCIWLMPIAESPSYHGYDVVDYRKVDPEYGTNDDFKRLVVEAHKRGINVILDLVLNHTSSEHPWFKEAQANEDSPYREWYIWSKDNPGYKGPWGDVAWHKSPVQDEYYYGVFWSGMPDLNYRNPAVTEEAQKISAFWLNEMGADGFRLDAIKHLIENGRVQENTPETHAWLSGYREFLAQTDPDVFTVGEIFGANPQTLKNYYPDQLDSYFVFDIGQQLVGAVNTGSAIAFNLTTQNAFKQLPFQRFAPFLTNHDQDRVMSVLGDDVAEAKIAATALLTLPGMPFLYYGEEIGMLGTKPDERIRTPMQWTGDASGFTTGQPWQPFHNNYRDVNVAAQQDAPASLLSLYRRLVHLHTSEAALAQGDFTLLKANNTGVAAFVRAAGGDVVLVMLNFGKQPAQNVGLSLEQSNLAAGAYQLNPLLEHAAGASLTVAEGGKLSDYVPLPTLEPQTGYIFKLTR